MSDLLNTGITIVIFLAILVVLVLVHELGHFIVARLAGVRVLEFGIGFPPRARVLRNDGETDYTLNWLPIGGFVRMEGEETESDDPRAFINKPLRPRIVILIAGVAMNLALAAVIFAVIAFAFEPSTQTRVESVSAGSPAAAAGLQKGDVITKVDGIEFAYFDQPQTAIEYVKARPGRPVTLTVQRASGGTVELHATLRDAAAIAAGQGALGITARVVLGPSISRDPIAAVRLGIGRTADACGLVLGALRDLVGNVVANPSAAPAVSGPIGIAQAVGTVRTEAPPVVLLWLVGLLSANLAIVNILPFPPLDGGRIAVALLRSGTRGRISVNLERTASLVGFALLFALLIWVSYFDIVGRGTGS